MAKGICNSYCKQLVNIQNIRKFLKSMKKRKITTTTSEVHEVTFLGKINNII